MSLLVEINMDYNARQTCYCKRQVHNCPYVKTVKQQLSYNIALNIFMLRNVLVEENYGLLWLSTWNNITNYKNRWCNNNKQQFATFVRENTVSLCNLGFTHIDCDDFFRIMVVNHLTFKSYLSFIFLCLLLQMDLPVNPEDKIRVVLWKTIRINIKEDN